MNESPLLTCYRRFGEACAALDVAAMRECVDADAFTATVPGQGRLNFDMFVAELVRLHDLVAGLGRRVRILQTVEQGDTIAVRYYMIFHHADKTERIVAVTSMDMVTFHGDKIVELCIVYDRFDTNRQLSNS